MKPETKEKIQTLSLVIFRCFWWVIVVLYVYIYINFMPREPFGTTEFKAFLFAMPLLTGLYVLLKTGDLI